MKAKLACLFTVLIIDLLAGISRAEDSTARGKAEAACARGRREFEKGDTAAAIKTFTEAVRLDPTYEQPYFQRAAVYSQMADWDKAIPDFSAGLALDARYPMAWYGRGYAHTRRGEHEKAIANYSRAV